MRGEALSSAAVCDIIKACSEHGVYSLEFGCLKLQFSHSPVLPAHPSQIQEPDAVVVQESEKDALAQAEINSQQESLSTLLAADPVEFERLMMMGELDGKVDGVNADNDQAG